MDTGTRSCTWSQTAVCFSMTEQVLLNVIKFAVINSGDKVNPAFELRNNLVPMTPSDNELLHRMNYPDII